MRKATLWISVLAVLAAGPWWWADNRQQTARLNSSEGKAPAEGGRAPLVANDIASAAVLPDGRAQPTEPGKQTAWRMMLAGDTVELLAQEELRGDFPTRRRHLAWLPGMLLCRLLDGQQRVLAEETLAAPDHACVVLDPQTPGMDGMPAATTFAAPAAVVFQVRLPTLHAASQLQVYRLSGPRPADAGAAVPGKLLGSMALQR
jgi:hypothetical protein